MTPPARILAATDLSAPARHAIDSLRELLGEDFVATRSALEADARERLSQLVTGVAAQCGVTASQRVVSGTALSVVAAQADTLGVAPASSSPDRQG